MQLNHSEIKALITGAVRIEEENGALVPHRFTKEQQDFYQKRSTDFYLKTFCSAGARLMFTTDSEHLFLKTEVQNHSTRKYFSFDVFVNEKPIGYLDNFSNVELPQAYSTVELPLGEISQTFSLGKGEKRVCIYLPWSAKTWIKELSIDDGAFVSPIKPSKKLLAFGDSITQGYDVLRPSMRYTAQLCDRIGAEEINLAIGGEIFVGELAALRVPFTPDYITVAYGTNDWSSIDRETFFRNAKAFFTNLTRLYPSAKIFALTPIWRKDLHTPKKYGEFCQVDADIRELTAEFANITVISCFDFVPHDETYFADLYLHPNDRGFAEYANYLYAAIADKL